MHARTLLAPLAVLVFTGCSTYALPKYSASADTVAKLRTLRPAKVSVGPISGDKAAVRSITCRGVGPVQPPEGMSFGDYVRGAIRSELVLAELYDEASPVRIDGTISTLDFSSGMTDASWTMSLTLQSTTGAKVQSSIDYRFAGSFIGDTACNQTAQAGLGAVNRLVETAVNDPAFPKLVKP
jgi:hypothetical protein